MTAIQIERLDERLNTYSFPEYVIERGSELRDPEFRRRRASILSELKSLQTYVNAQRKLVKTEQRTAKQVGRAGRPARRRYIDTNPDDVGFSC